MERLLSKRISFTVGELLIAVAIISFDAFMAWMVVSHL